MAIRETAREAWKNRRNRRATPLADLIGEALSPVCRRRGFATADLITAWADIVGDPYAETTQAEKLVWPRGTGDDPDDYAPATLVVRCDGPTALFLQHDAPRLIERINMFLGWSAVGRIKIIQRPLVRREMPKKRTFRPLTGEEERALAETVKDIRVEPLKAALERLGRAVRGDEPA